MARRYAPMVCSGNANDEPRCATTSGLAPPAAGPWSGDVRVTSVIGHDRTPGRHPFHDPAVEIDRVVQSARAEEVDDLCGAVAMPAQHDDWLIGRNVANPRRDRRHRYVVRAGRMAGVPLLRFAYVKHVRVLRHVRRTDACHAHDAKSRSPPVD